MFERLFAISQAALTTAPAGHIRPLFHNIDWESPLNAILGSRGVGKTSLLLQRLQQLGLPPEKALYVDLGDLYFQENRLLDFAERYAMEGGRYLFLDEVHRYGYGSWAQELKQVYDLHRTKLKVTFTGSSAIRILKQRADLSRRALQYQMTGLSFREYLLLKEGIEIEPISFADLRQNHDHIAQQIIHDILPRPVEALRHYWQEGYYPFFLEDPKGYLRRLTQAIQLVLEVDIPNVNEQGGTDYQKLGRLLYAIASSVPFKPNVSKLAARLEMGRDTLLKYLQLLEDADLILSLRQESKGIAALGKPDKVYLNNPNLLYALAPSQVEISTLRETFFYNQLHYLTQAADIAPPEIQLPKVGDFVLIDKFDRYVFEVGGPDKTRQQIGPADHHFAVIDSDLSGGQWRIPLWLFGLLY
ncbi:MAG: AAA family ATPase [Saprospiraceae bacterium]